MPPEDWTVRDLDEVIRLGLVRGGRFLTRGERVIAERIRALSGPEASLYARLVQRKPLAFEVDRLVAPDGADLSETLAALERAQLVDRLVPRAWRAQLTTRARLAKEARRLGLPVGGRKAELAERVGEHPGWRSGHWIRIRHRPLIRRLERWALLSRWRDRSVWVVERLQHARWPDYRCTPGPGLHRDRRALLSWERLLGGPLSETEALDALASGAATAGGPLDLRRRLVKDVNALATRLERTEPRRALAIYERLAALGTPAPAVRHARALERCNRPLDALAHLNTARSTASSEERLAIQRAGRRLARSVRRGWAPDPPLHTPPVRTLRLVPGPSDGGRPTWTVAGRHWPVEAAVIAWLKGLGRRAVFAENALWRTLFALCFADAYFLPVPGALPCRHLAGPLDLFRPAFAQARSEATEAILAEVQTGLAPDRIARMDRQWRGTHLAGAHWDAFDTDTLVAIAKGLGPAALHAIFGRLLTHGFTAARGLPDLVIFEGDAIPLPSAVPSTLSAGLQLVELKGPGDVVRDAQAVWFHHFRVKEVPIALWEVRPQT